MAKQSKQEKANEKRVEQAFYTSCSGVQVNIMDLSKITREGLRLIETGADDEHLANGVRTYVDTIRKN